MLRGIHCVALELTNDFALAISLMMIRIACNMQNGISRHLRIQAQAQDESDC